jgi:hypothetical protein
MLTTHLIYVKQIFPTRIGTAPNFLTIKNYNLYYITNNKNIILWKIVNIEMISLLKTE